MAQVGCGLERMFCHCGVGACRAPRGLEQPGVAFLEAFHEFVHVRPGLGLFLDRDGQGFEFPGAQRAEQRVPWAMWTTVSMSPSASASPISTSIELRSARTLAIRRR